MSSSYWRQQASPIIEEVLMRTRDCEDKVIREELRKAYPFGERRYHPYKIWCDEVRAQRFGNHPAVDVGGMKKLAAWEAIHGRRSE